MGAHKQDLSSLSALYLAQWAASKLAFGAKREERASERARERELPEFAGPELWPMTNARRTMQSDTSNQIILA